MSLAIASRPLRLFIARQCVQRGATIRRRVQFRQRHRGTGAIENFRCAFWRSKRSDAIIINIVQSQIDNFAHSNLLMNGQINKRKSRHDDKDVMIRISARQVEAVVVPRRSFGAKFWRQFYDFIITLQCSLATMLYNTALRVAVFLLLLVGAADGVCNLSMLTSEFTIFSVFLLVALAPALRIAVLAAHTSTDHVHSHFTPRLASACVLTTHRRHHRHTAVWEQSTRY